MRKCAFGISASLTVLLFYSFLYTENIRRRDQIVYEIFRKRKETKEPSLKWAGILTQHMKRLEEKGEISNVTLQKVLEVSLQSLPPAHRPIPGSLQIIVASTWRSGSTFLEELLASHLGVFDHYEPLLMYDFKRFYKGDPQAQRVQNLIRNLLKCRYADKSYLAFASLKKNKILFQRNRRWWEICSKETLKSKYCYDRNLLESVCSLFPWTVMKVVRLGFELLDVVLEDKSMNPHIVLLLRDPRAIVNSRMTSVKWCTLPVCKDPKIICGDMNRDIEAAIELKKQHPGRVHILRYEDLSLHPFNRTKQLLSDIGWDIDPAMEDFISKHTTKNYDKPWTTYRLSSTRVTHWTEKIKLTVLRDTEKTCAEVMEKLGYVKISTPGVYSVDQILLSSGSVFL